MHSNHTQTLSILLLKLLHTAEHAIRAKAHVKWRISKLSTTTKINNWHARGIQEARCIGIAITGSWIATRKMLL